jgi:hypothetical protein
MTRLTLLGASLGSLAGLLAACSDIEKAVTGSDGNDGQAQAIQMTAGSTTVPPGGTTGLALKVTGKGGQPVKDGTRIEVRAGLGRVEPADIRTHDGGSAQVTYRAGATPGTDRLEAVSGEARAELPVTIHAAAAAAPPPPAPPPGPAPGPAPPGSPPGFDPRAVTFLDPDISGWPETSQVTSATIDDPPICIRHTKAGKWPVKDGAEGNPWIVVHYQGRWYAATWEWLAPGQVCKGVTRDTIGQHIGRAPLTNWRPRSGELVGLGVSARARFRADTVQERSNLVWVRWP